MTLGRRLRAMSRSEVSWRLRTQLRARAEEAACAFRTPAWDRGDISRALAVETLPSEVQSAIEANDATVIHRRLYQLLARRASRFVLNQANRADLRREILARWPGAAADAERRAEAIAAGRFDLLGYRALSFDSSGDGRIDWHFDPVHQRRMPTGFWSRVPYLDPQSGDHKVVWELNRHQHWLTISRALWLTGDRGWACEIVKELEGWLAVNPPLVGANWASMLELAFRATSWLWSLHAIIATEPPADEGPWLVDLLVALDRQLTHIEHNLSLYFSPNTHLTGEALALYVAGAALPELAGSTRWVDTGRDVLLREIDRQIERDGGHAERSTHYHRYTLDFYLMALLTARRIGDLEAEERFREALGRLVPFAVAMADTKGRLPLIGDDDAGKLWPVANRDAADIRDSLGVAAAVLDRPDIAPWGATEDVLWLTAGDPDAFARALRMDVADRRSGERRMLSFRASDYVSSTAADRATGSRTVLAFRGRERRRLVERRSSDPIYDDVGLSADERTTRVFADTGYVTSSTQSGDHLVFDAGPHGYLNGGHAHADALSVVLTLRGQPLLVDPGTPTYTMNAALRDQLRSSLNHNTVTLDGASSAVPDGPFHWRSRADARLDVACDNSRFALMEAAHDGYPSAGHRRVILAGERGYTFADQVSGTGRHEAAQHWHFDPRWAVTCASPRVLRLTHESGLTAWLLLDEGTIDLFNGDESSSLGWFSPAYGVRVPTWTARLTHGDTVPFSLVSWCGVVASGDVPAIARIDCEADTGAPCVAVRVRTGAREWVTVLRPGDTEGRADRICVAEGIETDARALECVFDHGQLTTVNMVDGRYVRVGGGLLVEEESSIADLHLDVPGSSRCVG